MLNFELIQLKNGVSTIQNRDVQESMHSMIGSWEEAMQIYVQQAKLKERLIHSQLISLVIFDVGLGIGANALATLETFLTIENINRSLQLISFENNLNGIQFALDHYHEFPFINKYKNIIKILLNKGRVVLKNNGFNFEWILHKNDFYSSLNICESIPELIYYDFYSPKTSPNLWNFQSFSACYKNSYGSLRSELSTQLLTYCSSTAVRTALMLAGFYVGQGISTQVKKETTVASTCYADLESPLSLQWLEHLKRSNKPFPEDFILSEMQNPWLAIEKKLNPII